MSVKDEHIHMQQGKPHVLYPGLLDKAHQRAKERNGRLHVDTHLIQVPDAGNEGRAIVKASGAVEWEDDGGVTRRESFSGIGDASPKDVGRMVAPHVIRMAETRAKARMFRDMVDIAVILDGEDEGELASVADHPASAPRRSRPVLDWSDEAVGVEARTKQARAAWEMIDPEERPDWDAAEGFASRGEKEALVILRKLRARAEEYPSDAALVG